jgi:two-component system cell cycle sensor histidine kinase/response regulator CckA
MKDQEKTQEQLIDELNEMRRKVAELEAVQQSLSEKESRCREIVDETSAAIFVIQDGQIKFVNNATMELTGYSKEEGLSSQAIETFVHPDDRDMANQYRIRRQQGDNAPFHYDCRFVCKDGTVKWAEMNSSLIMWEGKPAGLCLLTDITERKRSEEVLQESEIVHRALCENIPGIVYRVELNEPVRMKFFNSTVYAITGFKETELTDGEVCSIDPLIVEKDRARVVDVVKQALADDKPFEVEYRIRHKSGSIRHLREYGRPIRSLTGEHSYIDGVIFDDTSRKQTEEALRRSERRFRELAELLPQTVFEIDMDGKYTFINSAALKLTGYSLEEFFTILNPVQLVIQEDRERVADNIKKFVVGQEVAVRPYTALRKDGSTVPILVYAGPICENGKIVGIRGVIVDISDLKQAEEEREKLKNLLSQSQKMEALGTLVGGIAHDFNNMLQIILGYSQLLLGDKKEGYPSYKDLQTIIQTAHGGADLVKKLLAFGQQAPIFPVNLDLNHKIRELIPLLSRTLPQLVKIDLDLTHGPSTIHADPGQIDQVVMNLAINASEAMPDGGHLKIGTTTIMLDDEYCRVHPGVKPDEYVTLSLLDTGRGMDRKTLAKVFEPFFSTKQRGSTRGTGLGLSVVQGIVEQHGGDIICESEPGKGSEFKIYFPAIQSEPTAEKKTASPTQPAEIQTILVVEDNISVAELEQRTLEDAGYTVIVATNGQEALDIYRRQKNQISLIILDLLMPEMSGRDCLMELVKIDPSVKVLIASGFSPSDELDKEINPLVKGFVQKPFGMIQLLDEVGSALGDKQDTGLKHSGNS